MSVRNVKFHRVYHDGHHGDEYDYTPEAAMFQIQEDLTKSFFKGEFDIILEFNGTKFRVTLAE